MLGNKRGQSNLEYALIIGVVVGALIALNGYMRRGVQGRLKESADQIGEQFDPTNFTRARRTTSAGQTVTTETRDIATGSITSTITQAETITRDEYEDWGTKPAHHY